MIEKLQLNSESSYRMAYQKSIDHPEKFWEEIALQFVWKKKWSKTIEWDFTIPKVSWFKGGKLNITENCLDRHLEELGNKTAIT